jgi:hypothetical protein
MKNKSTIGINLLNILGSILFILGVIKGNKLLTVFGGIGMLYFIYTVFDNSNVLRTGIVFLGIIICFFVRPWYYGFFYSFAVISIPQVFFFLVALLNQKSKQPEKKYFNSTEKEPFKFFIEATDSFIYPTIPRLYGQANAKQNANDEFVIAAISYELDTDSNLILQTLKPKYEQLLNGQDDLGNYWQYYNLVKKYYTETNDRDLALTNLTLFHLDKSFNIPPLKQMQLAKEFTKAKIVISQTLSYLKKEVHGEWVLNEIFEEDRIEYG